MQVNTNVLFFSITIYTRIIVALMYTLKQNLQAILDNYRIIESCIRHISVYLVRNENFVRSIELDLRWGPIAITYHAQFGISDAKMLWPICNFVQDASFSKRSVWHCLVHGSTVTRTLMVCSMNKSQAKKKKKNIGKHLDRKSATCIRVL